jgi:GNAT superfamily N-acetyltransferase
MNIAARLQAYLRHKYQNYEKVACPPFTIFFHETDRTPESNQALPDQPPTGDVAEPLRCLKEFFAARDRTPSVHYIEAFAPDLAADLLAAGFSECQRLPVMICTPASLQAAPEMPDLTMVLLSSESPLDEVREGLDANALGFDSEAALATESEAEAFRRTLKTSRALTAKIAGQPAGAGMFNELYQGVTELVGITTLSAFRGRGIGMQVTAYLAQQAFLQGADLVFLDAVDEQAVRVYQRVGFQPYTHLLTYQHGDA